MSAHIRIMLINNSVRQPTTTTNGEISPKKIMLIGATHKDADSEIEIEFTMYLLYFRFTLNLFNRYSLIGVDHRIIPNVAAKERIIPTSPTE